MALSPVQDLSLIADQAALDLGALTVQGKLDVAAAGGLTQNAAWTVAGDSRLDVGTQTLSVNSAGNQFGGRVSIKAGSTELRAASALAAQLDVTGPARLDSATTLNVAGVARADLVARAGGAGSFGTLQVGGALDARSDGNLSQSGDLQVSGRSSLNAGSGGIVLDRSGNDFQQAVSVRAGGPVVLTDVNDLQASLTAQGSSRLNAGGALTTSGDSASLTTRSGTTTSLGNIRLSGSLDAEAGTGMQQSAGLSVAGPASLRVTQGALVLDRADNDFGGVVTASAQRIDLGARGDLDARVSSEGAAGLRSGGGLTLAGTAASLTASSVSATSFGTTVVAGQLVSTTTQGGLNTQAGSTVSAGDMLLSVAPQALIGVRGDVDRGAFYAPRITVQSGAAAYLKTFGAMPELIQRAALSCLNIDGVGCVFMAPALQASMSASESIAPVGRWAPGEQAVRRFEQKEPVRLVLGDTVEHINRLDDCRAAVASPATRGRVALLPGSTCD